MMKKISKVILSFVFVVCSMFSVHAEESVRMWRLYNPNSGEHFYTASESERDSVYNAGWNIEGYGWVSPTGSNIPVYRVYNPNAGDHHYTVSEEEKNKLVAVGWRDEGIGWYASATGIPVYREYNPNAVTGAHNFTTSKAEHDQLVAIGWRDEGIAFYVVAEGSNEGSRTHSSSTPTNNSQPSASNPSSSTWDGVYVYSIRSNKFHKSNCASVTNMNVSNKRTSKSRSELISMGKTPCNVCNP